VQAAVQPPMDWNPCNGFYILGNGSYTDAI